MIRDIESLLDVLSWPRDRRFRARYYVPDLSPEQRSELKGFTPRLIFVAESPHLAEVESESREIRRPLCGRAGQEWWKMVEALLSPAKPAVAKEKLELSLERLLGNCRQGSFAVMNAVPFPLDPKIVAYYGKSADPVTNLGFSKSPPLAFKKQRGTPEVKAALTLLSHRLKHSAVKNAQVISLGNDARWFVELALGDENATRHALTVPHPSAWWRQGGKLREKARAQLTELLG